MDSTSTRFLMGKNRRCRTEIVATVITLAQNGESCAKLAEKARLNSKQLKIYLGALIKLGLVKIEHVKGRKVYITSQRGNQYLQQYNMMRKILT